MRIEPTLRALADPTRLRIMRLLDAMELAVGELAQVLGQQLRLGLVGLVDAVDPAVLLILRGVP